MKRLILVVALSLSTIPSFARAQVAVSVHVGLPVSPPLVVVQPGIQVVENYDEEVFFTGGWYWVRRGGYWYRARTPRSNFMICEQRRVPPGLARIPPGQYRHWNRAEAKAMRREEKAERKAWKQHAKAERREERREERERGHGHHER